MELNNLDNQIWTVFITTLELRLYMYIHNSNSSIKPIQGGGGGVFIFRTQKQGFFTTPQQIKQD